MFQRRFRLKWGQEFRNTTLIFFFFFYIYTRPLHPSMALRWRGAAQYRGGGKMKNARAIFLGLLRQYNRTKAHHTFCFSNKIHILCASPALTTYKLQFMRMLKWTAIFAVVEGRRRFLARWSALHCMSVRHSFVPSAISLYDMQISNDSIHFLSTVFNILHFYIEIKY